MTKQKTIPAATDIDFSEPATDGFQKANSATPKASGSGTYKQPMGQAPCEKQLSDFTLIITEEHFGYYRYATVVFRTMLSVSISLLLQRQVIQ